MISLFIMLFIAIGIAAGIGFAIVTLINTAQTSLAAQSNNARLQNMAASVTAGLTTDGDRVLLPVRVGDGGQLLARIPSTAPFGKTTSGKDVVLCPALPPASAGQQMLNGAETINVDRVDIGEKTYIAAGNAINGDAEKDEVYGRLREIGVVAYLLSPQPNFDGALRCSDVRFAEEPDADQYTLLVPGGNVVPVFTVANDAARSVFVVDEDAGVREYSSQGRVAKSVMAVSQSIRKFGLTDVTLRFPSGTTDVAVEEMQALLDAGAARTLRFLPYDGGTVLISIAGGNAADFTVTSGATLHIEGVDIRDETGTPVEFKAESDGGVILLDTDATTPPVRQTVYRDCPPGVLSCEAECPAGKAVVSGGCSTLSGTPLVAFGPAAYNDAVEGRIETWECAFHASVSTTAPKATAICE